jgi:hypothetical protein
MHIPCPNKPSPTEESDHVCGGNICACRSGCDGGLVSSFHLYCPKYTPMGNVVTPNGCPSQWICAYGDTNTGIKNAVPKKWIYPSKYSNGNATSNICTKRDTIYYVNNSTMCGNERPLMERSFILKIICCFCFVRTLTHTTNSWSVRQLTQTTKHPSPAGINTPPFTHHTPSFTSCSSTTESTFRRSQMQTPTTKQSQYMYSFLSS